MEKEIRLDKFLTDMGKGTRSQVKGAVRKGRVRVNGYVVKKAEQKVQPSKDQILFDLEPVAYAVFEYFMLNKPQGVISATEDSRHKTVVDLITVKKRKDLFPVGRLDIDTEGLLLITNDGDLAHRLLAPKKHVDKTYYARCAGHVPDSAVKEFAGGVILEDGFQCLPADLTITGRNIEPATTDILLTIHEGKFHQVKRMMEACGCPVIELKRLSMGPLSLDETLKPGEFRPLTEHELELLDNL